MKRFSYIRFLVLCSFVLLSKLTIAQNNLSISFKDASSSPQNLSICGDPYEVTIKVSLNAGGIDLVKGINADVKLFKGIRILSFNSDKSTPGVTANITNPYNPKFLIPDLAKNGIQEAQISYSIAADCDYLDTLGLNDKLIVKDKWKFDYLSENNVNLSETDLSAEYRDALKLPFLLIDILNKNSKHNVGQDFQRTIQITNGGLNGYLKNLVYTNLQGSGIYIKSVKVNNQNIPITKTVTVSNDTLITVNVPGSYFIANMKGQGGQGNNNNLLDPDELVTIVETGTIVGCVKSRMSQHSAEWGCYNKLCSVASTNDEIQVPQGSPFVEFNKGGSVNDENAGYCKSGVSTVTFKNTGIEVDPGTANMFNITTGIGLGNGFTLSDGGFKITSLKISGKNIPTNQLSSSFDLNNNPLFNSDPDGPGGLADLDGDGFFDDLPRNQSFEVTVQYDVVCLNNSIIPVKGACINNITTAFIAKLDYSNFCNDRISYKSDAYFIPLNILDSYENCSDPDAFTDGPAFYVKHEEIRNVFNFEKQCSGDEKLIVSVILPKGIVPVINEISLKRLSEVFPMVSNTQNGDTLKLTFNASSINFLNGIYTINLAFKANCQANPGQSIIPIIFEHYCPSCDCTHTFYCENITGPVIHYMAPPCNFNVNYDCAEGLNTTSFEAVRTTLGFSDKSYSTKIDPTKANLHAAISCDSVKLTLKSVVGKSSISDSVGIKIQYANVDKSKSGAEILLFDKGQITFTHAGQTFIKTINKSDLTIQKIDSLKILTFNLNNQLKSLGIILVSGDQVNFEGMFLLNPDGPYTTKFSKIPDFRAYSYALVNGVVKRCDDNGETFEIAKTKTGFIYPTTSTFPKGCQETTLEYALIQVNNGYNDVFPGEFRPASKVDSLKFNFDPEVLSAYTIFQPEVSIPGHPIYGNNFFPVNGFTSSGKYIAKFDTLGYVPPLNTVGTKAFIFRFKMIPNCKSLFGSANSNNVFNFDPTLTYQSRYHAHFIGDGSCVQKSTDFVDDDIVYNDPPNLSYILDSQNNGGANDEITWNVKLCNTSQVGDAGITWFNIESSADAEYQVISIRDITNPGNPKNLSFKKYGPNNSKAFVFDEGLSNTQNGGASFDNLCNLVEIKIKLIKCGSTGFISKAGWNCVPYSNQDWTPDQYIPCQDLEIQLPVNSSLPKIDANFVNQNIDGEDLCDETTLELLIRNTDIGVATGIKTQFTIPGVGAQFVPGSVQIAYPSNSNFVSAIQDPVFQGLDLKGQVFVYEDFSKINALLSQNGLAGFNPQNPGKENEFRIKFKFKTNCDFISGSYAYHSIFGKSGCGEFTKVDEGESLPLIIKGAPSNNQAKLFKVKLDPSSKIYPGLPSKIRLSITNLEDTPTDNFDKILFYIPSSLSYILGSSVTVNPNSWNIGNPEILSAGGQTILKWMMPAGVQKNQTIVFEFDLNALGVNCTDLFKEVSLETIAERKIECKTNNTVCDYSFNSTENGKQQFQIPITKPVITIVSSTPNVSCSGDPIKLTANGGNTYSWNNLNTGQELGGGQSIFVTPTTVTTYQVTGVLGNCTAVATISLQTVIDKNPPIISNVPKDVTVQCDEVVPVINPTATDDCDANVEILYSESTQNIDKCIKKITRTWVAKDDLGNTSSAQQMITIIDSKAPVISFLHPLLIGKQDGDTITVNCGEMPVLSALDAIVKDNCDPNPNVEFVDYGILLGDCTKDGYFLLMVCGWVAEDNCGNKTKVTFYFKIIDNTPPVLSGVPADIIINFDDPIPPVPNVTAKDLCDDTVLVDFKESMIMVGCQTIIVRTWKATDDCMNMVSATQTIKIKCNPCVLPEIISTEVLNASCSQYGSIKIEVKDPENYEYTWVPNLGVTNVLGNHKSGLYPGAYNLIISSKKTQNCFKKYTFNIIKTGSCVDTLKIKAPNDQNIDTCLNAYINLQKVSSVAVCHDNPMTASIQLGSNKNCITIKPNSGFTGNDLLCVVHCDQNICDTTYIKIELFKNKPSVCDDIITLKKSVIKTADCSYGAPLCIEIPFTDIINYEITDNGIPYQGFMKECLKNGLSGTEMILKKGTHKLVFQTTTGCTDTVEVKVTCDTKTTVKNSLYIGEAKLFTLDQTNLGGEKVTITKTSKYNSNSIVEFNVRPSENLITYTGLKPGIVQNSYLYTAEDGSTDLITFDITVKDDKITNQVVSNNYHFSTTINKSVIIETPEFQSTNQAADYLNIFDNPSNGKVISAGNKMIEYIPLSGFCGQDQFKYTICQNSECQYSTVTVDVTCEDLIIYNGITPNNDGINDIFVISGVEAYKESSLKIFNRWGQEVYSSSPYLNDWSGQSNGKILPDGTYFFMFDNGEGTQRKGYIYLQR